MEQGPIEAGILRQTLKLGIVPPKIAEAPQLRMGLELYYAAFYDLVGVRSGFGDGPILWTAIADYARAGGFDEEQTDDLFYYITRLDAAYMDHVRKKTPKAGAKAMTDKPVTPTRKGKR